MMAQSSISYGFVGAWGDACKGDHGKWKVSTGHAVQHPTIALTHTRKCLESRIRLSPEVPVLCALCCLSLALGPVVQAHQRQ